MNPSRFTPEEREKVHEYWGAYPEALSLAAFEEKHRELRGKYHPDIFEKFNDATIQEMAAARFREIEKLAEKIRSMLQPENRPPAVENTEFGVDDRFAGENVRVEIITSDKDLKYNLFGTQYSWLERGDRYKIRGTEASITIDANHSGHRIGFNESIKMYLTFSENDSLETVFEWLYTRIEGRATAVIIGGQRVQVDYAAMLQTMKRKTVLRLN